MADFLQLSESVFVRVARCAYANAIMVAETNLYVDAQNLVMTADKPKLSPQVQGDRLFRFKMNDEGRTFQEFYLDYMGNSLFWYRGFNCSHFSYPRMQGGVLKSEGDADLPTFTMGNSDDTKTRWLPGCFDKGLAANVGISGMDRFTLALGEREEVPISVTVKVRVGVNSGRKICWLNSGEQVLRGPLVAGDFRICAMLWMKMGQFDQTNCDLSHAQLPPERPYEPSQDDIDAWWPVCKAWIDANYVVRRGMTMTKLTLVGLAPPTYGANG